MEDESRFCVGFYRGLRSTQRTVVIESVYLTHVMCRELLSHIFHDFHGYTLDNSKFNSTNCILLKTLHILSSENTIIAKCSCRRGL